LNVELLEFTMDNLLRRLFEIDDFCVQLLQILFIVNVGSRTLLLLFLEVLNCEWLIFFDYREFLMNSRGICLLLRRDERVDIDHGHGLLLITA